MSDSDKHSISSPEETYFANYANKASKMNGWQLTNELAMRLESFDLLKNDPTEDDRMIDRAMRQIEILSNENLNRKYPRPKLVHP